MRTWVGPALAVYEGTVNLLDCGVLSDRAGSVNIPQTVIRLDQRENIPGVFGSANRFTELEILGRPIGVCSRVEV